MKATVTINMDNAAFQDDFSFIELSRILEKLSRRVLCNEQLGNGYSVPLQDINGNKVGDLTIDE